jgi:hypothetical protein
MEYILSCAEQSNNLKEIIHINQNMLYKLKNKKRTSYIGGNKDEKTNEFQHRKDLAQFKDSSISIIKSLEKPIKEQQEMLAKSKIALDNLIKYLDMLHELTMKDDLEEINSQLTELKKKIEEKM